MVAAQQNLGYELVSDQATWVDGISHPFPLSWERF